MIDISDNNKYPVDTMIEPAAGKVDDIKARTEALAKDLKAEIDSAVTEGKKPEETLTNDAPQITPKIADPITEDAADKATEQPTKATQGESSPLKEGTPLKEDSLPVDSAPESATVTDPLAAKEASVPLATDDKVKANEIAAITTEPAITQGAKAVEKETTLPIDKSVEDKTSIPQAAKPEATKPDGTKQKLTNQEPAIQAQAINETPKNQTSVDQTPTVQRPIEQTPQQIATKLPEAQATRQAALPSTQQATQPIQKNSTPKPKPISAAKAYQNMTEGYKLMQEGDNKAALSKLEPLLTAAPKNADLHNQVAMLKYQSKDYSGAVKIMEKALKLNPTAVHFLRSSAMMKMSSGDLAGAITDLEKALKVKPNNVTLKTLLKSAKRRLGAKK